MGCNTNSSKNQSLGFTEKPMPKDKPKSPLSPMELMLKAVEKAAQEEENPEEFLKVADPIREALKKQKESNSQKRM